MKRIWPVHGETFEQNFNLLSADLDELNKRFESFQNVKLLASHPAYNYLSKRYGWDIINFDFDPSESLDENQIKSLKLALKKNASKVMLWEQMPLDAVKKNLKEKFSIDSIHFSPCESVAASDLAKGLDYLKTMNLNLDKLESVYQKNE